MRRRHRKEAGRDSFAQHGMSVWRAILMAELPFAIDKVRRDIIIRINGLVVRRPVADLEIDDFLIRFIDQTVRIARAGPETGAHSGSKLRTSFIGVQRRIAGEDVDEFILLRVRMPQGRCRFRLQ